MTGTVILTGAGRAGSIAHGVARALAEGGWDIAFTTWPAYERRVPLGADPVAGAVLLEEDLLAYGVGVLRIEADLADPATPEGLFAEVRAELGPVNAIVLSHSESVGSGTLDTTVESFDRHLAVNARAAWLMIRELARQPPANGGRIVALTSDDTMDNLPYGASKGALDRIVTAAARELGHLGITANLIDPGPIDTGWMDAATRTALTARQPTGRLGRPDDIGALVRFLLSDEGRWVTGQLIRSDGGFSSSR